MMRISLAIALLLAGCSRSLPDAPEAGSPYSAGSFPAPAPVTSTPHLRAAPAPAGNGYECFQNGLPQSPATNGGVDDAGRAMVPTGIDGGACPVWRVLTTDDIAIGDAGGFGSFDASGIGLTPVGTGYLYGDGSVLTYKAIPSSDLPAITLTGDSTGTGTGGTIATTNGKVNGTTYPAGGALVTGTYPRVTGASAVTYSAIPSGDLPSVTLTGDTTGTGSGGSVATTTVSATGTGTNELTGSGTIFKNAATEQTLAENTTYKLRVAMGTATTSDSVTWVDVYGPWTPPNPNVGAMWSLDCVAVDMSADGGAVATGDLAGFHLEFIETYIPPPQGIGFQFTSQFGVSKGYTIPLAPQLVSGVLDGGTINSTSESWQVTVADAGPDSSAATQMRVQVKGFSTATYMITCSDQIIQRRQ